jgi:hypothetical protein
MRGWERGVSRSRGLTPEEELRHSPPTSYAAPPATARRPTQLRPQAASACALELRAARLAKLLVYAALRCKGGIYLCTRALSGRLSPLALQLLQHLWRCALALQHALLSSHCRPPPPQSVTPPPPAPPPPRFFVQPLAQVSCLPCLLGAPLHLLPVTAYLRTYATPSLKEAVGGACGQASREEDTALKRK